MRMNVRVKLLREIVADGLYVIDESAVAEAVVARAMVRCRLPDVAFRTDPSPRPPRRSAEVRSFRPHRGGRSFRLARDGRRAVHAQPADLAAA